MPAYCYFLRCENDAFYIGWTTNVNRRFSQHSNGKGAYYTKIHRPIEVVYWESHSSEHIARKREINLKKLTRKGKEKFIRGENLSVEYSNYFQDYDYFVTSPGRVNLIGEHVDYNGGSVLPCAINRSVSLWANESQDDLFSIHAIDLDEQVTYSIESLSQKVDVNQIPLPGWALYPASVVWAAQQAGYAVHGLDAHFSSNIPIGSGLSSSAAVECAFAAILRELGSWQIDNLELALLCQNAERNFVGVNCGIMDQFACANGVENSALYLNTADLQWQVLPFPKDVAIVIADSHIRRNLATSAYNERRTSCEDALSKLKEFLPSIHFLSDVSPQEFTKFGKHLDQITYKRAKHVVEECQRVKLASQALQSGNIQEFGELMKATHASLRDLYEVSIPPIDILVDIANAQPVCFGSRLTGAGFGGCTVSLVPRDSAKSFMQKIKKEYLKKTGLEIEVYVCKASNGVNVQWRKR